MAGQRAACRALLALSGGLLAFLNAPRLRALDAPAPFRVDSLPGAICESGETFTTQLLRRTSRIRTAKGDEPALVFRVEVLRGVEGLSGRLTVHELEGTFTEREVTGASCQEVVAAMALIAAVLVDPNASLAPLVPVQPPAREPERKRATEPESPANMPSPPSSPGPPKTLVPAGVRPPRGALVRPRATAVDSPSRSQPRDATSDDGTGPDRASPKAGERTPRALGALGRLEIGVGAGLALEGAAFSKLAPGAAFLGSGALERRSWLSPLAELSAVRTKTVRVETPSGTGEFRFAALRALACPVRFPEDGAIEVRPCALGEVGVLEGFGKVTDRPERVAARWLGLGGALRASLELFGPITLVAEPGLVFPLIRHEFYFDPRGPETTALQVASFGFSSRVGVAAVLR